MSSQILKKPFILQKDWTPGQAFELDDFLNKVVRSQLNHRHGSYTGTGRVQVVPFPATVSEPLILALFNRASGAHTIIMEPGVNISAWSTTNFTLAGGAAFNTDGIGFMFFLLADTEL